MPVSSTLETVMNQDQIAELSAVMSLTSDRVIAAWQACADALQDFNRASIQHMIAFSRRLYAAGVIDHPPSNHPMTARKMRGAFRRLKAGEIGVRR